MAKPDSEMLDDFLGEEVVDTERTTVGTLSCYWEDENGKPALLGIDLDGVGERTHLAPAKDSEFNERHSYIVIPFEKDEVENAPSLECGCEMDAKFAESVFDYYGVAFSDERDDQSPRGQLKKKFRPAS